MYNKITLIGRLTKDPEMRTTSSGTPVTNMRLAVERPYSNKSGEKEVDYINLVAWRKLAETCAQHLGKGRLIAIDGSLQIRNSESNGRKYINPEVMLDTVKFLDYPDNDKGNGQNNYQQQNQQQNFQSQQQNFQNQNYQQHNNQQQNYQNNNQQQNQNQFNSADINVPF